MPGYKVKEESRVPRGDDLELVGSLARETQVVTIRMLESSRKERA